MEINSGLVWVTPDPNKVSRVIAMKRNGRWTEVYRGERILVHESHLWELQTKGFMVCEQDFDKFVFKTPEEAINCEDKLKLNANGSLV